MKHVRTSCRWQYYIILLAAACWHHSSDNIISSQKNHTKIEEYIDETDELYFHSNPAREEKKIRKGKKRSAALAQCVCKCVYTRGHPVVYVRTPSDAKPPV